MGMDAEGFVEALLARLPLARAVMEAYQYAFDRLALEWTYEANRGRCYTDTLTFPEMVGLVRDALLEHQGSGHRMYEQLKREGNAPADQSCFYRKLANMPVEVSRALLRESTVRLTQLITPCSALLPGCVEDLELVVLDGKKVKDAAKRLLPTRTFAGSLLGAKALVAMSLRSGLAIAMSDSLDGEANEVPLVDALIPQVLEVVARAVLFMADRQFGDYKTHRLMRQRPGDHVLLRVREKLVFVPEEGQTRSGSDEQGRKFIDEIGVFGTGVNAERMRRITLYRTDAAGKPDNIVLITDLLDRQSYPADDLLKLYRRRWGIEQMFQEVTETFSLENLISCSPKGILFQLSLCLLMYNLVQVVKAYVAADGFVERARVSTANLFYDVKRELTAAAYLAPGALAAAAGQQTRAAEAMCRRLSELLAGTWDPVAYPKAADKKPRPPKDKPKSIAGGHTSVQRLLEGKVKTRWRK
jgi:hypothetical protein